jgi:hypothetical protein
MTFLLSSIKNLMILWFIPKQRALDNNSLECNATIVSSPKQLSGKSLETHKGKWKHDLSKSFNDKIVF